MAAAETKAADIATAAGAQAALAARDAELTAGDIIKKAEEKSRDLVAAGELQRTQARGEAIRMQKLATGVRVEFTEMVSSLLAEVERTSGTWSVSSLLAEVERTSGTWSANGHALPHSVRKLQSRVEPE